MPQDPLMPKLSRAVCGLCLSTIKSGVNLIRGGKVEPGINHLEQLISHVEKWQADLDKESDEHMD